MKISSRQETLKSSRFCDLFLIRKNKLPQAEISHFLSSETWVHVALLSDLWAVGLIEMQGNILNK